MAIEQSMVRHYPQEAIQLSRALKLDGFGRQDGGERKIPPDYYLCYVIRRQPLDNDKTGIVSQCQARIHETR